MISVDEALAHLFLITKPLCSETVNLKNAVGRILIDPAIATRNQPPFDASAMDGYAICGGDLQAGVTKWNIIGEAAAGHRFLGSVAPGEATRIFTGAPMPTGTDHVLIQEHVTRCAHVITLRDNSNTSRFVRPLGADFKAGFTQSVPCKLSAQNIALLASMNVAQPKVARKPQVVLIATGDELVQPGEVPNIDQIIASNTFGLFAMLQSAGAEPRMLPIAKDRMGSLKQLFSLIGHADLVVTVGGASVGDHDLVAKAAEDLGMQQSFYKVAMRPGKPLMAGKLNGTLMIGLPGNPVSAMVCGEIFIVPVIQKMLGLPAIARQKKTALLNHDLEKNGPREHYMRANVINGHAYVEDRQDSALLSVLATSNALVVRSPNEKALPKGATIEYINLTTTHTG